ncbi:MAG: hypothetical protein CSA97_04780 [Bacteroidetes bacterium]|nr:MAG: hypothetical protein CSA97_04780 [Bacteroidota bacterium]
MKTFYLTIILDHQTQPEKARRLAARICRALDLPEQFNLSPYDKFPDCYKLILKGQVIRPEASVEESLERTWRLANTWIANYRPDEGEVELMFVRNEDSRFRHPTFSAIRWAHWEIVAQV